MRDRMSIVVICVLVGARVAFRWRLRRSRRTHSYSSLRARMPTDVAGAARARRRLATGDFECMVDDGRAWFCLTCTVIDAPINVLTRDDDDDDDDDRPPTL